MNRVDLIHYMLDLEREDFDRVLELYRTYSTLSVMEQRPFLRELDGIDRGLLKEISFAEKIHGSKIKEEFRRRGHDVNPEEGGWGWVLSDIRFRRIAVDPDYLRSDE